MRKKCFKIVVFMLSSILLTGFAAITKHSDEQIVTKVLVEAPSVTNSPMPSPTNTNTPTPTNTSTPTPSNTPKPTNTPTPTNTTTPTPLPTPTSTPTPTPIIVGDIEIFGNVQSYKYYEVYDFFYRSDRYHALDFELQELTYDLCVNYGIEEYFTLILCQLYYESEYKTTAKSKTNDYGIAQINKCNHEWLSKELGITDFLDPKQSILCNVYMMSGYIEKYGPEKALTKYNTGKAKAPNKYTKNIMYMWENGVREIENKQEVTP